jgi:hypothetical protein
MKVLNVVWCGKPTEFKVRAHVALNIARYQGKYLWRCLLANSRNNKLLYALLDWLALVSKDSFTPQEFALFPDIMQQRLVAIARRLPVTMHGISLHLLYHLPHQVRQFGPLKESWCFGFERLLAFLKRGIKNRARPSSSLLSSYLLNIHLMSKYSWWSVDRMVGEVEMEGEIEQRVLDADSEALARAAAAAYPISSVRSMLVRQDRTTNGVWLRRDNKAEPRMIVLGSDSLAKANLAIYYYSLLCSNAYIQFVQQANDPANPDELGGNGFEHWAAHCPDLQPVVRRFAAGLIPTCGPIAFFLHY